MKKRQGIWAIALLLALAGLILSLNALFPGALSNEESKMRFFYALFWLMLVGTSVFLGWRERPGVAVKQALAWVGIALVLVIGYSYRDVFFDMGLRIRSELLPSQAVIGPSQETILTRNVNGHFFADATINGRPVRLMVDTGASNIALSAEDAERIGIDPTQLSYIYPYQTANGIVLSAHIKLEEVSVGSITISDVTASISKGELGNSLLGMSFLNRLSTVEVRNDKLILRQ